MEQSIFGICSVNLEQLRLTIERLSTSLEVDQHSQLLARLKALISVYPFSEYEYILTFLVDRGAITFQQYENLRSDYVHENRYLDLFGLAPRAFGQVWGEQHLLDLDARFQKASRSLDPDFDGEYDLWISGIRVEVKASRAINTKKSGSISSKALRKDTTEPFWMNYQQLKPEMCDAFVFIAVWVNEIEYWVLSSSEIINNPYLSKQHRGGIEYQIGFRNNNIHEFDVYKVGANAVADALIGKVS